MNGNPRQAVTYAYLAGLFDGEGSFRIQKYLSENDRIVHKAKHPTYHAQLVIGMVDRPAVEMFREVFGGGTVREERVPERRSIWRWALTGRNKIIAVIDQLMPYLLVKRDHAVIVRGVCAEWETPFNRKLGISELELRRREEAYLKIRKLNAVGAAATTK